MRAFLTFWANQGRRFANAAIWSTQGARACWVSEDNFKQWTVVNVLSVLLAFMLDLSGLERAVIVGFGLNILVVELLNTAIETTIDRFSTDIHPLSKKAKDIGSAAVALSALIGLFVWLLILFG